jgi:hypothetical protein
MDARSRPARACCILLALTTLHVAMLDLPRQVLAETTEGAPDTQRDLEDRQGWSADKKALEATKRATDLKAQANRRKSEPCPAAADWDKWFQETLDLEASWVAMKEVRDKVRKSGAGSDTVKPFRDVFGSVKEWEALVNALRQSMIDCAKQLNVKRGDSSDEFRMVTEREQQRRAIELGELGFGPRMHGGCLSGDCPPGRATPHPAGSMWGAPSMATLATIAPRLSAGRRS